VRFELEGGPDLEIFSPDGRRLFLWADLETLPPGEAPEARAATLAGLAAAAARRRASILSFDGQVFSLHREANLRAAEPTAIPVQARALLNDWDWWRQNRPAAEPAAPPAGLRP
jgi:hypothetical protein